MDYRVNQKKKNHIQIVKGENVYADIKKRLL